jgi:hypothetical protein
LSLRSTWFSPGWDVEVQARYWRDLVSTARKYGATCRRYLEIRYENLILQPEITLRRVCTFLQLPFAEAMLRYYDRTPDRLREHEARVRVDGTLIVSKEQRLRQQAKSTQPPDTGRVLAWRSVMDPAERRRYDAVAGPLLEQLGYEVDRSCRV